MKEYTSVKDQVEYGLDSIAPERTIEVSLRDLFYVHQVLGEFVRFFHQPMHYPTLEHVEEFLGNVDKGAAQLLCECFYTKLREIWPDDIVEKIDNSVFQNPTNPFYYAPTDES